MSIDKTKVQMAIHDLLVGLGEDPDREGLSGTPDRVARFYEEWFSARDYEKMTSFSSGDSGNMVVVGNIPFYSMCEHHLLPICGKCSVGYIPTKKVLGLSKLVRAVYKFSRRLQIQEQLTEQIAKEIERKAEPKGVIVVMKAEHLCMSMRGVRARGAETSTVYATGVFNEIEKPASVMLRQEFFNMIGKE